MHKGCPQIACGQPASNLYKLTRVQPRDHVRRLPSRAFCTKVVHLCPEAIRSQSAQHALVSTRVTRDWSTKAVNQSEICHSDSRNRLLETSSLRSVHPLTDAATQGAVTCSPTAPKKLSAICRGARAPFLTRPAAFQTRQRRSRRRHQSSGSDPADRGCF